MILVGIDPGVNTGYAIWNGRALVAVECMTILQAMKAVEELASGPELFVIFEDARKRKWYGNMDHEQGKYGAGVREGVGSVKRDCAIWEEFLQAQGIPFEARYPHSTKMKAEQFQRLTGWTNRTNEHARDAALIVFGMNEQIVRAKLVTFSDEHTAANRQAGRGSGAGHASRHGNGAQ